MCRIICYGMLFICCFFTAAAQPRDSINVYFDVGASHLSARSIKTIDSLVYNDVLAPGRKVGIIGYADIIGSEQSNQRLSTLRALAVRDYLLQLDIDSSNIEWVTGRGAISRPYNKAGYPEDRKVQIVPGGFGSKKSAVVATKLGDIIRYENGVPVIDANAVEVNTVFKLDKVYFQMGRSDLLSQSLPMLDALAMFMRDNPGIKIQVEGHVCCADPYKIVNNKRVPLAAGEKDTAQYAPLSDLSTHRATSVFAYLVYRKGIEASRVKYVGYGVKHRLVDPEVTDADRAANRRVEIRIIAK